MRAFPHRPVWAGLAAVLALAGLGTVPAASAADTPAPPGSAPTAALSRAMQRDLGLTAGQVRDRLDQEGRARQSALAVRGSVGDRLAGLWFDAADGRLHAAVSSAADAGRARRAGAVPHRVRYSAAQLRAAVRAVGAQAGAGVPGVVGWGPAARADRVEVRVDARAAGPATAAFLHALARFGDLVETVPADGRAYQQSDVVGGEKWIPGSESPCSIGFSVTRSGGAKAFLTAGHCTNDSNQPAYGKDGSRVGTSNRNGTGSVNAREGDMGIVDVDQAGWNLAPTVAGYGQGDITVTGAEDAVVGTAVCRSGQTTGLRCGEVTKVDQSVDYGNVVIDGLSYTSACSAGGDSGGSYVTASGGKAVGLHSGGGSATCTSGSGEKFTIFQPVKEALTRFGAALVTSAPPAPGTVTVAPVAAQSTVLGAPVTLRNSAAGGTAPYAWSATGLPAGLGVDSSSGTVTGSPTSAGTSQVTLTATDATGAAGSVSFAWTVTTGTGGTPVLDDPGNRTVYVGRPVSLPMHATGGTAPYAWP
ncbi:putative Ig domain-containing protein [Streptomyces sp. NPDC089919]|uniref:putative Ig domain-containing protein n=1 Tax=Streptomyces sp. NPDC089919 TaxID=3155188 RepID=UPI0034363D50